MFTTPFAFLAQVSAGVQLLLDDYPDAIRAYSVRKLRTAYGGSALRVRRSSDNTEQDIGFIGEDLNTSALTTFVGGGTGFIRTWYDQTGNEGHYIQTLTANQPRIVIAGSLQTLNSKPAIRFLNPSFLNGTSLTAFTEGANTFNVIKGEIPGGTWWNYNDDLGGASHHPFNNDGNCYEGFFSTTRPNVGGNPVAQQQHIFEVLSVANSFKTYFNDVNSFTSAVNTVKTTATPLFGKSLNPQIMWPGFAQEHIIYAGSKEPDRVGITNNLNSYFSVY